METTVADRVRDYLHARLCTKFPALSLIECLTDSDGREWELKTHDLDDLLAALAAAREDASQRRWERDHAQAAYERVRDELAALQGKHYAGGRRD